MTRQVTPLAVASFVVATAIAACDTGPAGQTIHRDVFIDTYVDLRLAALAAEEFVITPEQRLEILSRRGVDEERLLGFADVHGADVDFMNEVWAEVERRLDERRPSEADGSA
jgi:hypothetical protein